MTLLDDYTRLMPDPRAIEARMPKLGPVPKPLSRWAIARDQFFQAPQGMEGLFSGEDLAGAQKDGMLNLGLSLLADSGPRTAENYVGPTASIGRALKAAKDSHATSLTNAAGMRSAATKQQGDNLDLEAKKREAQQSERLAQVMAKHGQPDPNDPNGFVSWINASLPDLVRGGHTDMVKSLSEVRKAIGNGQNVTDKIAEIVGPDGKPAFGYVTPAGVQVIPGAGPPAQRAGSGTPRRLTTLVNPATKQPEVAEYNPATGRFRFTGQKPGSASQPSEMERKAQALSEFVTPLVPILDAADAPGRIEMLARTNRLGEVLKEDAQKNDIAGRAIMEAWLRLTTGAAYNAEEMGNSHTMLVPLPGDKPGTITLKRKTRQGLLRALRRAAGRAYEPVDEDYSKDDNLLYEGEDGQ